MYLGSLHRSDGVNCPGSVHKGVKNYLRVSVPRIGFVSQGELVEKDVNMQLSSQREEKNVAAKS